MQQNIIFEHGTWRNEEFDNQSLNIFADQSYEGRVLTWNKWSVPENCN